MNYKIVFCEGIYKVFRAVRDLQGRIVRWVFVGKCKNRMQAETYVSQQTRW